MKTRFTVAALTVSFVVLAVAVPARAALKFEGLRQQDQDYVRQQTGTDALTAAKLDALVKDLMTRGPYTRVVALKSDSGDYVLRGVIQRQVTKVAVEGATALDETDVLNALGIKSGARLDRGQLAQSAENLRELYGRSGYFNPVISITVEDVDLENAIVHVDVTQNQPCQIDGLEFKSANPSLVAKLRRLTKKHLHKPFSEKRIADLEGDINSYLQVSRYLSARLLQKEASYNPEKTKAILVYEVQDPYAFDVIFTGDVWVINVNHHRNTRSDLLRVANLNEFDRTSLNPGAEIAERIRKDYVSAGYAHVKIGFETTTYEARFSKTISISISEGPRVEIDSLKVVGRLSRSSDFYSDFIEDNSSDAIADGYYVKDDLELGYKNLLTALNNQGYLRAKLQSSRVEFNDKKNQVKITVLLDEGPLTQIKDIRFKGVTHFKDEQLLRVLGLKPNSPLRLNQLEDGIQRIKDFYRSQGYIEMGIQNERSDLVQYDKKGYEADIAFDIVEGPQVMVKEILVEGNNFTKDYVVLREIEIDPGDILTPEKLNEARSRLEKLSIFSRVELRTVEANSPVSKRTLLVSVTEKNPGSFRIGLGLNNKRDLTARGFSGISYNNLWGTARAVSLRGSAEYNLVNKNYLEYEVSAGYLEPFMFSSNVRGRVNVSREEKVTDELEGGDVLEVQTKDKLAFALERDISSKIKFTWNTWSLESVNKFLVPDQPGKKSDRQQIATVGPLLDIDYRDNPFLPTRGTFTRLEGDYSDPNLGSSDRIHFYRAQGTFSFYQKLWTPKLVWANSLRGGYEENLSSKTGSGIPDSYAYFLGGYTTIRGYSGFGNDRIPAESAYRPGEESQLFIPAESKYYLVKTELRFPIYGIIGGVLFFDGGRVYIGAGGDENGNPLDAFDSGFRKSAGLGIRVNTPVGPISIDYGRKLNPRDDDRSKGRFHLSIGTF